MSSSPLQQSLSISEVRAQFTGQVIGPDDPDYDVARTVFPGGVDRRPAVIVRVADAAEVARVFSLARQTGLELSIRSGGHGMGAHCAVDGGMVLDLSAMRTLEIDRTRRVAWAQSGLTTGAYTKAAAEPGLATGFGDTGSVGIGGITLGGGVGYLSRKHGLTIDDLLAAEIVMADGQILQIDAESHPDLFWAIRGGGGNFGVVTKFQFRLHALESVVGGMLLIPATADIIQKFVAEASAAPEELTTIANVMPAPPMPFVPAEHHGRLVIMALMAYAGATDAGQRAIAPFRALATPIVDMVKPCSYAELFPPEQEGYHPIATVRTMFIDNVDRRMAETMVDHLTASTAQMAVTQLRVLGGAVSRVPNDATAYGHRARPIMVNAAAVYGHVDEAPVHRTWLDRYLAALNVPSGDAYVNFLGPEGDARVRDAYPEGTWTRLSAIKRQYDPTNFFRSNQNIPPATE